MKASAAKNALEKLRKFDDAMEALVSIIEASSSQSREHVDAAVEFHSVALDVSDASLVKHALGDEG